MKNTQIGLNAEFPYQIRTIEVYCWTLCNNGKWKRSPLDEEVKAFRTEEEVNKYIKLKGLFGVEAIIPYKEWEKEE